MTDPRRLDPVAIARELREVADHIELYVEPDDAKKIRAAVRVIRNQVRTIKQPKLAKGGVQS